MVPFVVISFEMFSKSETFPFVLESFKSVPSNNINPALSYPLYSSLLRPFIIIGYASLNPIYPTIPHIILRVN